MTTETEQLFPAPSLLPISKLSPRPWPGVSPASIEALRESLIDNHNRFHVFFDPRGFHNHTSHYIIALWALGASEDVIREAYKLDVPHQAPIPECEEITAENHNDHLGDARYYGGYVRFYTDRIRSGNIAAILEEHVFGWKANFDPSKPLERQPSMFDRFLDLLYHPLIHVGYGVEMDLPGMVVEGLASAAVHQSSSKVLLSSALWEKVGDPVALPLASRQLSGFVDQRNRGGSQKNVHAFTVLARMLKDHLLDDIKMPPAYLDIYNAPIRKYGEIIAKYSNEWTYDQSDPKEVERKLEEVVWVTAMIYGIGGWHKDEPFDNDFIAMHLVTSSLFLPSILAYLKPHHQELLLRGYFATTLAWWVARARHGFDISGFFAANTAFPIPNGPLPPTKEAALPSATSPRAAVPNPWFPIIQTAITNPDDHIPKVQRALAHWGSVYGNRPAGLPDFAGTELEGADKLDGTLFIRVAGLTDEKMARWQDGYDCMGTLWARKGFVLPREH